MNTNSDGLYYIYNIPPGSYNLEIWVSRPPRAYPVQVVAPLTDVPPIVP